MIPPHLVTAILAGTPETRRDPSPELPAVWTPPGCPQCGPRAHDQVERLGRVTWRCRTCQRGYDGVVTVDRTFREG